ncbi:mucin-2-like [Phymastichus coffea]|uniref:mucin-2-like n=1 Tax=Phymastichus coffea TaxID=108790 RepID=UPI00273BF93F|nr:mucin-2-like [Phymastichus coffea]
MRSAVWSPLLFASVSLMCASADFLMGGHLDNKNSPLVEDPSVWSNPAHLVLARTAEDDGLDLIAEESSSSVASTPYPDQEPRYKVPFAYAFNGGKPFSLEKDPITGKIDLGKTPPLKALNLTEIYQDEEETQPENDDTARIDQPYDKVTYSDSKRVVSTNSKNERVGPNEINPYSPSFHDFLNLPVKYTSEKYNRESYPLISSSYANTKVQSGSNSYNINNHRPSYHQETVTETSVSTQTRRVYYPKTTSTSTTTTTTTTSKPTTTSTTTTTTTPRPTEKKLTTMIVTKPTTTTTTTTTTIPPPSIALKVTTWKPSKSTTQQYGEFEEMLPIEKMQGSKYGTNYPTENKEVNGHNNGPQSFTQPASQPNYEYSDGYEYYDSSHEEIPLDHHQHPHVVQNVDFEISPSTLMTTTTTTSTTTTTTPPAAASPATTTTISPSTPTVHLTTNKPAQQTPVTSLPLDSPAHVPPVHENFVESHRPVEFFNSNNNNVGHGSVHFPGSVYGGRPGSVISVLPESTSNVIVPHDQDTVSFVLGNRQNVEGSYYSHGAATEEHPLAPNSNKNTFRPMADSGSNAQVPQTALDQTMSVAMSSVAVVDNSQQQPQPPYNPTKWYTEQQNGNFASQHPSDSESQNTKAQSGFAFPPANDATQKDEAPTSTGFVTFPEAPQDKPDEQSQVQNVRPVEEHVIVINQADGSIKEITPTGPTNLGGNSNGSAGTKVGNPNLPQLSERLTPPAKNQPSRPPPAGISPRPPYYFHYQHANNRPNSGSPPSRPQRIPLPPRQKPEYPPVGFKRRPPPHDQKLPNILPQFRPNAKTSHGHRGTDKIGTLPAPQSYPNRPRPTGPQSPPPHIHPSRKPQPHPISAPPTHLQRLSPPPPPSPNQQPPHHHHHHNQILRKKEEAIQQLPPSPEQHKRFRPPVPANANPGRPVVQKLRMEDEIADRFSAEPPQVPPRPIIFPNNRADSQMPKVATLQMIQQRGGIDEEIIKSNLPPLFKINRSDETSDDEANIEESSTSNSDAERRKDSDESNAAGTSESGPVYVVYPVNSAVNIGSQEDTVERDESVVIGTRGPHRPLPPDTLPQDDEEEHKDGDDKGYFFGARPQFNQVNGEFPQNFPPTGIDSPMLVREKPLLVPSDEADEEPEEEPNVISYLQDFLPYPAKKQSQQQQQPSATISATLPRLPVVSSSSPIAFVYTPTTPVAISRHDFDSHEDEKPVLLPSQQPSSSSSSAPSPQNFMAPFVASVSAEMPAKNGWSVVVSTNNGTEQRTNHKEDTKKESTDESIENETQTERNDDNFDPDNFKPVLFGGFKPIYEFPVDEDQEHMPMVGRGVVSKSDSETLNVNAESGRKLSK